MLAEIPFGLHAIDDAPRPGGDEADPLGGSDAKLMLGVLDTGDIDNPTAAF